MILLSSIKKLCKYPLMILRWIFSRNPKQRSAVQWGTLRQITPVSRIFGIDRGACIDRYYIEKFLHQYCADITGCVLEVADAQYTKKFGGEQITRSEVLHAAPGNPHATIVGDLATGRNIPTETFDCLLLTQVFPFIYDLEGALATSYRALKPKGVLLATLCGISQISRYDMDRWGDYWRFTDASARRLFETVFAPEDITIETHGNVLAACSFLHGLASEELKSFELDYCDPDYQIIITVRAKKNTEKK